MDTVWQTLQQMNPLWGFGSLLVTIVGIILMVIIYKHGQNTKAPRYFIKTFNIITDFSSGLAKLQLFYDNNTIETLSISKIAFWNDGTNTIDKMDIAEASPIRIVLKEGYDILDASVISEKNPSNIFRLTEIDNGRSVGIVFDYLDRGEGGIIQLIHTGSNSSDIEITGTIKGAGFPKQYHPPTAILADKLVGLLPSPKPQRKWSRITRIIIGGSFLVIALALGVMIALDGTIPVIILGILSILLYVNIGYSLSKRRIPQGFEIVEEELC